MHVLIPLINTRNKKDKILYWSINLISLSNTKNIKMALSTKYIGLIHVTNTLAVTKKNGW